MIPAWSYSRLQVFEQCPQRAYFAYIEKIPEPERELPPGKTEHANDRGTRVHEAAELFVQQPVELIPELQTFKPELLRLRDLYSEGKVSLEGNWGFNRQWEPVGFHSDDVWLRVKLDAFVRNSATHAVAIDYKTGKRWGNEIKHAEQMQLYVLSSFMRYPELNKIDVELWYTDLDELEHQEFTRGRAFSLFPRFDQRGHAVTSETEFPARPNIHNCRFCPYHPTRGTGHCSVGV